MNRNTLPRWRRIVAIVCCATAGAAAAAEIGQIKVAQGEVSVERAGRALAARVGLPLEAQDTVRTGADGSVGITMRDDSRLSLGPNSTLALARFEFDPTTQQGRFDSQLQRGTLAAASGRIAKQTPKAMTVRTPTAVLAARGTEFVVSAGP